MYTDFRRLKTAKIEGGAYIAPPQAESSTLFGRLYRVNVIRLLIILDMTVLFSYFLVAN